jgi:hypothetical protein
MVDLDELHNFILAAKANTYIGDGQPVPACRPQSHDLAYESGDFGYLDSYFGGSDFIGEEVVYHHGVPVWAMNYYGTLLKPNTISAEAVGQMIKASLSRMYSAGRFLGGWTHSQDGLTYHDTSGGDLTHFSGREWIERDGQVIYELVYHGGLVK